jgi:DNA polymerase III subunit epsilon
MFLIIDTETTGLFDFKAPADAPGQPRMAQLGLIYLDHVDAEPVKRGIYIKPDGWEMSEGASAVNGLTTEFLAENGVPVAEALDAYESAILEGRTIAAFNAQFDCKVLRAEMRRAGRPDLFEETKNICVMRAATDVVKVLNPRGHGFKWPKLAEACEFFGITNLAEHDAMGDAEAALAIFQRLYRDGLLPEAAVHYAKEPPVKAQAEGGAA